MSGLFGLATSGREIGTIPDQMGAVLLHLPHQRIEVRAVNPQLAIGRHHIGILNQSAQPLQCMSGEVLCWLCGEFYHQPRQMLTDGQTALNDTQLALQLYIREGIDALMQLSGAFLIAIWDARVGELMLINDRFGLYPHYYSHTASAFAFAPEIKSILQVTFMPQRLSDVALAEYLRFQQVLGDKTWFEDIRLLPAGTLLRYRPLTNHLELQRYWHPSMIPEQKGISVDEAVEEAGRLFVRAVDAMSNGSERIGVYLSGGLDGRMILGAMRGKKQVTTVTFGDRNCRDVFYAAQIAKRAGSNHIFFPLDNGRWIEEYAPLHLALTEGQHCWMHAHGITTYGAMRSLIDVNLSGWEGEMTLGGLSVGDSYEEDRYYRYPPSEADFVQRVYEGFCTHMTWPGLTEAEALALLSGRGAARLRTLAFESMAAEVAKTRDYPAHRRLDYLALEQHCRRPLQQQIVIGRAWVEVRCPFFDNDFLAFIYALPLHIQTQPQFRRRIITQFMPHLSTIPNEKDERLPNSHWAIREPHALFQRVKKRVNHYMAPLFPQRTRLYADYEHYLRSDLRTWAESILFDQRSNERGLFDPDAVRALWERHCSGKELWTIGKISPLISIELVLRALYDGSEEDIKICI